jgi:hypothetical protein
MTPSQPDEAAAQLSSPRKSGTISANSSPDLLPPGDEGDACGGPSSVGCLARQVGEDCIEAAIVRIDNFNRQGKIP